MRVLTVKFIVEVTDDPIYMNPSHQEESVELKVTEDVLDGIDLGTIFTRLLVSARKKLPRH